MNDLANVLLADTDHPVRLVYGVATAANTVAVRGSSVAVALPAITPVASGDYCAVLESGADRVIVGPVGVTATTQRGSESFSFSAESTKTDAVVFASAFSAAPIVVATVTGFAGATSGSTVRVSNTTASGFDLNLTLSTTQTGTFAVNWIAIG